MLFQDGNMATKVHTPWQDVQWVAFLSLLEMRGKWHVSLKFLVDQALTGWDVPYLFF